MQTYLAQTLLSVGPPATHLNEEKIPLVWLYGLEGNQIVSGVFRGMTFTITP